MAQTRREAVGLNGTVGLLADRIRIARNPAKFNVWTKGLWGYIRDVRRQQADREILLSSISSVQLKRAHLVSKGYIRFTFQGSGEPDPDAWDPARDENTVVFGTKQQSEFEAFKAAVDEVLASARPSIPAQPGSDLDELRKVAALRDEGVITQEEFEAKKKQLLGL